MKGFSCNCILLYFLTKLELSNYWSLLWFLGSFQTSIVITIEASEVDWIDCFNIGIFITWKNVPLLFAQVRPARVKNWYFDLHLYKGCCIWSVVEVTCCSTFSGAVDIVFKVFIFKLYVIRIHFYIMTCWLCEMYPHDFAQTPIVWDWAVQMADGNWWDAGHWSRSSANPFGVATLVVQKKTYGPSGLYGMTTWEESRMWSSKRILLHYMFPGLLQVYGCWNRLLLLQLTYKLW
jgi:hypothetical protein